MRVVFLQAVDQYQKIEASMPTKQYGMAAGLICFGADGYEAVASETRDNLHGRAVIDPVRRNKVTHDIRKASLPYLMFLKRKRCGKIKGIGDALTVESNKNIYLERKLPHQLYRHMH